MVFVRILVDGYSLLHHWPELAAGKPRYSAAAREELIHRLCEYQDIIGTPITVVFDGVSGADTAKGTTSTPEVEILYSHTGQSADQVIERATHCLKAFGDVLVVTDDMAEVCTVESVGAIASSSLNFIQAMDTAREHLARELKRHNQKERKQYLNLQ